MGLAGMAVTASAQVFTFEIDEANASIPDLTYEGVSFKGTVSGVEGTISTNSFRVNLDIAGDSFGNNGDLYVFLSAPTGEMAVLVNRPGLGQSGSGYSDNGLNVTFFDGTDPNATHTDIHWYQNDPLYVGTDQSQQVTGVYKTDGRSIEATVTDLSVWNSATRNNTLATFEGINPNGDWSLFVADCAAGGSSALKSWGLDFTPIPEPHQYAMVVGAGLMAFAFYRNRMRKTA